MQRWEAKREVTRILQPRHQIKKDGATIAMKTLGSDSGF
jgi:hypothetical protein